jgi:hypothetical protein
MQTFLPYKDFDKSAHILDSKRLNKQILEGYQILKVLNNPDPRAAWRNHPAVRMWKGFENALFTYVLAMLREADYRGIKTDKNKENLVQLRVATISNWGSGLPKWFTDKKKVSRLTESHRANLYRKDPEFYDLFRNDKANPCCEKCQYYWVTHEEN